MEKPMHEVLGELNDKIGYARELTVWFDGACEPRNPGGVATCGWVIRGPDGALISEGFREVCRGEGATNNVAEWSALGLALRWLLDNRPEVPFDSLKMFGDSKLVVNQLNGSWACKKVHLQRLRARCRAILEEMRLASWRAVWIPREQNEEADALSRKAYVEATGKTFPERTRR